MSNFGLIGDGSTSVKHLEVSVLTVAMTSYLAIYGDIPGVRLVPSVVCSYVYMDVTNGIFTGGRHIEVIVIVSGNDFLLGVGDAG